MTKKAKKKEEETEMTQDKNKKAAQASKSKLETRETLKPKQRVLDGTVDEEGSRYLYEVDLLKWSNSILRIRNLRFQADSMRQKAENVRMQMERQMAKLLSNAGALEESAKRREMNDHVELIKDMGARYGVDFEDKNIVIDDETGKIKDMNASIPGGTGEG